ncbi:MAG: glycosyltransferase, partial [Planctomycetes bacterium]|nr:glycosyltransferase [Planctomycetota bacterium]
VATAHGGALDIVEDGQSGFLVPPDDSKALAKAIERVLALSPAARQLLSQGAHKQAERFDRNRIGQQMLNLYRELVDCET